MKEIISCSRRTDIPWWYYGWLQDALKAGSVELTNWYSNTQYTIDLSKDNVHSIVLWSKNYSNFLKDPGLLSDYNLYFQFTLNGYSKSLEPNTPSVDDMIIQMRDLAEKYSPKQINWRFDPIVLSTDGEDEPTTKIGRARLNRFEMLCAALSKFGIFRCTISFMDLYDKVEERMKRFSFVRLTDNQKIEFAYALIMIAKNYGIQLYSCSQTNIESVIGIKKGHCIDGEILTELFGDRASKAKDQGQRKACGCSKSRDIGKYDLKCSGNCLYCYANPKEY